MTSKERFLTSTGRVVVVNTTAQKKQVAADTDNIRVTVRFGETERKQQEQRSVKKITLQRSVEERKQQQQQQKRPVKKITLQRSTFIMQVCLEDTNYVLRTRARSRAHAHRNMTRWIRRRLLQQGKDAETGLHKSVADALNTVCIYRQDEWLSKKELKVLLVEPQPCEEEAEEEDDDKDKNAVSE